MLRNVPENSTVVGVPGHIVYRNGERVVITDPKDISDPLSDVIAALSQRVAGLQQQLQGWTSMQVAVPGVRMSLTKGRVDDSPDLPQWDHPGEAAAPLPANQAMAVVLFGERPKAH